MWLGVEKYYSRLPDSDGAGEVLEVSESDKKWEMEMAIAPQRLGIGLRRFFTTEDRHPYDDLVWDRRDARISNFRDGSVAFEQLDVEVPAT